MSILIEACVETVASAIAAERGGARRLKLCAAIGDAGTTPSTGMITAVKANVRIPVIVIIRPRGGGFVYSDIEMDVMRRDIEGARASGADGVAIGVLTRDSRIDATQTRELVRVASGMPVTFHRAFDMTVNLEASLDALIDAAVTRLLTSGGATSALEGAGTIAALRKRAAGRLEIMAGGGIREANVAEVVRQSGVSEVHVRPATVVKTELTAIGVPIRLRKILPDDETAWEEVDELRIHALAVAAGSAQPRAE
jgi:copper homeostasis protein